MGPARSGPGPAGTACPGRPGPASSYAIVPAQKRPCRSHFPSFIRIVGSSAPTSASTVCEPSASSARNPSAAAITSPPLARTATAPTSIPTSMQSSRPVAGSKRCTADPVMSTQTSVSVPGSQIGPSPTSARVRTTSSDSMVQIPGRGAWLARSVWPRLPTNRVPVRILNAHSSCRRSAGALCDADFQPEPRAKSWTRAATRPSKSKPPSKAAAAAAPSSRPAPRPVSTKPTNSATRTPSATAARASCEPSNTSTT